MAGPAAQQLSLPDMYEEMPPSSNDLQMPTRELDVLLSVYGTLRSFSFLFRLSPFPLRTLCEELQKARMSSLIDEIAVQLMKTIHDFPPELDGDSLDENAVKFTGDPDCVYMINKDVGKLLADPVWRYLDNLTWPEFMRRLMIATKYTTGGGVNLVEWLGHKEWHLLPVAAKVASLQMLVDLVWDSPIVRAMVNGWEEQQRLNFIQEKEEIAVKKKAQTKQARRRKGGKVSSAMSDDSDDGKEDELQPEHDHLYVRDGLEDLEQDHCEIVLSGGKLVVCDGCPASYRKESVGLKRVSHGEDDKVSVRPCRPPSTLTPPQSFNVWVCVCMCLCLCERERARARARALARIFQQASIWGTQLPHGESLDLSSAATVPHAPRVMWLSRVASDAIRRFLYQAFTIDNPRLRLLR